MISSLVAYLASNAEYVLSSRIFSFGVMQTLRVICSDVHESNIPICPSLTLIMSPGLNWGEIIGWIVTWEFWVVIRICWRIVFGGRLRIKGSGCCCYWKVDILWSELKDFLRWEGFRRE